MIRLRQPLDGNGQGFVLAYLLITMMLILSVGLVLSRAIVDNYLMASADINRLHAQLAADAGIDLAVTSLNLDGDWIGTDGEVEFNPSENVRNTYEITVTSVDEYTKIIESIGRTYLPSSEEPRSTRRYVIDLRGVSSGGEASVVTGVGGLVMTNSSKILDGTVYVNGTITMSNTAQIGLASSPVNVRVAHANCPTPVDASYPRVCASGENGQPITMTNSSHIYGNVQATNQTTGTRMTDPGLVSGSPAPLPLPAHDRIAQINAVTNNLTASAASCSNSGTRNWPANVKITGNVSISNSCQVTVNGNVWITGNLSLSNSSRLITAEAVGSVRPNIMIDGSSGLTLSNTSIVISNGQHISPMFVTYNSSLACSIGTTLATLCDVTGSALYNSRSRTTINISNGSGGTESVFYARWTQVILNNSGNIGSVVGQTVNLSNSSAITFGSAVPGVGSPPVWVIQGVRRG